MSIMKHPVPIWFVFVMLIVVFLSSCKQRDPVANITTGSENEESLSNQQISNIVQDNTPTKVDQDTLLYNTPQKVYDYKQIEDAINRNIAMEEFWSAFNITKIKTIQDMTYTVMNSTEGFLFVTFTTFDESLLTDDIIIPENAMCREIHIRKMLFSEISTQKFFDTVQEGMSVFDVKKTDPIGNYDFLSASWSEYPQFSYHFFEDGNAAIIQYEDNLVIKITHFTL